MNVAARNSQIYEAALESVCAVFSAEKVCTLKATSEDVNCLIFACTHQPSRPTITSARLWLEQTGLVRGASCRVYEDRNTLIARIHKTATQLSPTITKHTYRSIGSHGSVHKNTAGNIMGSPRVKEGSQVTMPTDASVNERGCATLFSEANSIMRDTSAFLTLPQ
jgi:hypothetical protein